MPSVTVCRRIMREPIAEYVKIVLRQKEKAGQYSVRPPGQVRRAGLPRIEDGVNARGIMVNDNRPLWFASAQKRKERPRAKGRSLGRQTLAHRARIMAACGCGHAVGRSAVETLSGTADQRQAVVLRREGFVYLTGA